MKTNKAIFREYDIRGIYGDSLTDEVAYHIGRAFGHTLREQCKSEEPSVCVGYDGRISSPNLNKELCRGLMDTGIDVRHVGCGPTPMLYYATHETKADGGIMVTGSHNPPTHNGFKFMLGKAPFFGRAIKQLKALTTREKYMEGSGRLEDYVDILPLYTQSLIDSYRTRTEHNGRKLRVAWDPGNGATGEVVQLMCARIPGQHFVLNGNIDGTFPAHHPDPTVPENLKQLIATVKREKCDLGVAFDGDGDRIGVVDEEGEIIWGDQLLALYAADVLARHPGARIIADVKASQVLFDEVTRLGGVPEMWKTGHSHIKARMLETGAPLAGEMSGHMFFADDWFGFDDGLYAAVRLLALVANSERSLSELRKALPVKITTPEWRIDCTDEKKFDIVEEVSEAIAAKAKDGSIEVQTVDGVRVKTPNGWWLLRASNTQPMLVARAESDTQEGLDTLLGDLKQALASHNVRLPF